MDRAFDVLRGQFSGWIGFVEARRLRETQAWATDMLNAFPEADQEAVVPQPPTLPPKQAAVLSAARSNFDTLLRAHEQAHLQRCAAKGDPLLMQRGGAAQSLSAGLQVLRGELWPLFLSQQLDGCATYLLGLVLRRLFERTVAPVSLADEELLTAAPRWEGQPAAAAGALETRARRYRAMAQELLRQEGGLWQLVMCKAVAASPLLWSAWEALAGAVTGVEHLHRLQLLATATATATSPRGTSGPHMSEVAPAIDSLPWLHRLPARLFRAKALGLTLSEARGGDVELAPLLRALPGSLTLRRLQGRFAYERRDLDAAASTLQSIAEEDPYSLDGMEVLSNVLFVREDRIGLATLARRCVALDPSRKEAASIAANYHSLRGEHGRAAAWFKRALRAAPDCTSTWTLLGHEYLEMRNTGGAIECYRRAADLAPRDFRPLYGLGQVHEMLGMDLHALHYYREASAVQPGDARVWAAVAACAENMGKGDDAEEAYRKAADLPEADGACALKLARILAQRSPDGTTAAAAKRFRQYLTAADRQAATAAPDSGGGLEVSQEEEAAEAALYLARHAAARGAIERAEALAQRVAGSRWAAAAVEAQRLLEAIETGGALPLPQHVRGDDDELAGGEAGQALGTPAAALALLRGGDAVGASLAGWGAAASRDAVLLARAEAAAEAEAVAEAEEAGGDVATFTEAVAESEEDESADSGEDMDESSFAEAQPAAAAEEDDGLAAMLGRASAAVAGGKRSRIDGLPVHVARAAPAAVEAAAAAEEMDDTGDDSAVSMDESSTDEDA